MNHSVQPNGLEFTIHTVLLRKSAVVIFFLLLSCLWWLALPIGFLLVVGLCWFVWHGFHQIHKESLMRFTLTDGLIKLHFKTTHQTVRIQHHARSPWLILVWVLDNMNRIDLYVFTTYCLKKQFPVLNKALWKLRVRSQDEKVNSHLLAADTSSEVK